MTLEEAITIMCRCHFARKREGTGEPYILHPLRVMASVKTDKEKLLAVLHDTIEDNEDGDSRYLEGLPPDIFDSLVLLTRMHGERYSDYIDRIATSGDMAAIHVKLADLQDNLVNIHLLPNGASLRRRYDKAINRLLLDLLEMRLLDVRKAQVGDTSYDH